MQPQYPCNDCRCLELASMNQTPLTVRDYDFKRMRYGLKSKLTFLLDLFGLTYLLFIADLVTVASQFTVVAVL